MKLHNVPDCYWTAKGISKLASVIGQPLSVDSYTSKVEIMPFAKICVLYHIGNPLPLSISAIDYNPVSKEKSNIEVKVSYINKPMVCSGCHSLGHLASAYPMVSRIWVQKSVQKHQTAANGATSVEVKSTYHVGEESGVKQSPLSSNTDEVLIGKNDTPPQEHSEVIGQEEWTEVRAKRKPPVAVSPSLESPSPPVLFKNLVVVDEVDKKRGKLSSKARKRAKRALGNSSPQS